MLFPLMALGGPQLPAAAAGSSGLRDELLYSLNSFFFLRESPPVLLCLHWLLCRILFRCVCSAGLEGEICLPCPDGASCPGDERFEDKVNSTAGFWRSNEPVFSEEANLFCAALRNIENPIPARAGTCPVFRPCEPVAACLGNNTCKTGYTGERCMDCVKADKDKKITGYYRVNGEVRLRFLSIGTLRATQTCAQADGYTYTYRLM